MKKGFLDGYNTYDTSRGYGNAKKWRQAFEQRFTKDEAEMVIQGQPSTPYAILGVSPTASETEIKKAFRQLILQWHPDRNQHRLQEAEEMSKKIIAAYSLLS